ncbi:RNA transcription, translation and transport factor protein, partial [Galemys pyrenaicus]
QETRVRSREHVPNKLTTFNYHSAANFNCKDETEFRHQKIRHYKIEDKGNLRNIHCEPLSNLDITNPDIKADVMVLANLVQTQSQDGILVQEHLTQDAVAEANQTKKFLPVAIDKHFLKNLLKFCDYYIQKNSESYRIETNEARVAVQAIIAHRTDHTLG